jgi:hypothetical protein
LDGRAASLGAPLFVGGVPLVYADGKLQILDGGHAVVRVRVHTALQSFLGEFEKVRRVLIGLHFGFRLFVFLFWHKSPLLSKHYVNDGAWRNPVFYHAKVPCRDFKIRIQIKFVLKILDATEFSSVTFRTPFPKRK